MRSAKAEAFNHDTDAADYDTDARNDADPIRTGYREVLAWVIQEARITRNSRVLELGSGTGNLSQLIAECAELVAVDVSEKMEAIAKLKLQYLTNRLFVKADILEVFGHRLGRFDAVISTYAVHHLTDDEKQHLFEAVFASLLPGGRAVFGDLMFQNNSQKAEKIQQYLEKGDAGTAQAIAEEFFWSIDLTLASLGKLGFEVEVSRFSDLSYGVVAEKPAENCVT